LLAHASLEKGAVIVFEPSGIGDERLFREAIELSHIVKYSRDRIGHLGDFLRKGHPLLEIQTFGEQGLRYRLDGQQKLSNVWKETEAFHVTDLRDTVGAGDWCTAGILHVIARNGSKGLRNLTLGQVENGIMLGQALAAVNCKYEGARGMMYSLSKRGVQAAVKNLLRGKLPRYLTQEQDVDPKMRRHVSAVCPSCRSLDKKKGAIP
jgi:fructokinase